MTAVVQTVQKVYTKVSLRTMRIREEGNMQGGWQRGILTIHLYGDIAWSSMEVTGSYRNDAMLRQVTEAVQIKNTDVGMRMNDRAEWNMTRIPRSVITTGTWE